MTDLTPTEIARARELCGSLALTADQHARHPYADSGIPCGCASCVLAPMLPALLDALAQARAALAERDAALEVTRAQRDRLEDWIRVNVTWVDGHACITGDCQHGHSGDCIETLRDFLTDLAGNAMCAPDEPPAAGLASRAGDTKEDGQ